MKVLLTSDLNPDQVNGVVISIQNLMGELEKRGVEVRLLCLSPENKSYVDGNIYYMASLPFNIYPDIRASLFPSSKLMDDLLAWEPDLIHSQCEFFTYSYVESLARRLHCPIVHTYHTLYRHYVGYLIPGDPGEIAEKLVGPVMRWRLRTADVIIAPTIKTKRILQEGGISDHIVVIPTGIDLDRFACPLLPERREAIREKLGLPKEAKIYGTVGRLAKEKNISEILRAHARILSHREDAYLVLVGDGKYREELEEESQELGIADKVRLTGMVSPESVHEYYKFLRFFVSASVSETQGLTYIEALANGLPVLAREDPAIEGVVEEGKNGFSYADPEELEEAILRLLDDEALLSRLKEGAEESRDRFGRDRFGEKVHALYQQVLQTEGPTRLERKRPLRQLEDGLAKMVARTDYGKLYELWRTEWERKRFTGEKSEEKQKGRD